MSETELVFTVHVTLELPDTERLSRVAQEIEDGVWLALLKADYVVSSVSVDGRPA